MGNDDARQAWAAEQHDHALHAVVVAIAVAISAVVAISALAIWAVAISALAIWAVAVAWGPQPH